MKKIVFVTALIAICGFMFTSCEKNNITVSKDSIILHKGECDTISVKSPTAIGCRIGNAFHACIRMIDSSSNTIIVQGKYVGETSLSITNDKDEITIPIKVDGMWNTYEDPNVDFDDTRDSVKLKLGYPTVVWNDSTDYYLDYSTAELLSVYYDVLGNLKNYVITFDSCISNEELVQFVEERYAPFMLGYYMNAENSNSATKFVYVLSNKVLYMR